MQYESIIRCPNSRSFLSEISSTSTKHFNDAFVYQLQRDFVTQIQSRDDDSIIDCEIHVSFVAKKVK